MNIPVSRALQKELSCFYTPLGILFHLEVCIDTRKLRVQIHITKENYKRAEMKVLNIFPITYRFLYS